MIVKIYFWFLFVRLYSLVIEEAAFVGDGRQHHGSFASCIHLIALQECL